MQSRADRLIDKDQSLRVQARDFLAEILPLAFDLRGVPLSGVEVLFLARDLQLPQGARDRRQAASDAQALTQFLECGIGPFVNQIAEPLQVVRSQRGGPAPSMRFGFEGNRKDGC